MIDLKERFEQNGYMDKSFAWLHGYDQNELKAPLLKDPRIRALAPKFTLTSKCLSFKEFYTPLLELEKQKDLAEKAAKRAEKEKALEATKESRANSFLSNVATQPVRKPQKTKKKGGTKSSRPADRKQATHITEEPAEVPVEEVIRPASGSTAVVTKQKKEKVKQPTSKQKRETKKAAAQEEFNQAVAERMAVADRNKQAQERMIEDIQVKFDTAEPSLDELNLYGKIWGPVSQRKTLSWGELRSQLEGYGWSFSNSDGAYIIMTPPNWFNQITVLADPALKISFRFTKFMIHKPHDDALAPMPPYVIAFLRTELGGAIGLSEIVVNAMIKEIHKKK